MSPNATPEDRRSNRGSPAAVLPADIDVFELPSRSPLDHVMSTRDVQPGDRRGKHIHGIGRSALGSRRSRHGIGPSLLVAVMVPVVALSVLGVVGVVQRYRDAGALSGVVTQVGRVERTLGLYAGLVDERTGSESIVVAAGLHISPAQVSRLSGYDVQAELRSARATVDAAIAAGGGGGGGDGDGDGDGDGTVLGKQATRLVSLRARIDAGTASKTSVVAFFNDTVAVAEAAWNVQLTQLTETSLSAVGSAEIHRAIAGLADTVDAFIAGVRATTAAGALAVPGVPGTATGVADLAAANALYADATSRLGAELGGHAAAVWRHLIVTDADVNTFQRFVISLIGTPVRTPAALSIPELARIFRNGLIFGNHLGQAVAAAAAEVAPLAHGLQNSARTTLQRYLFALGLVAVCSAAVAVVTAGKIVRPLRRLAVRASAVSAGALDSAPLAVRGPKEVATVTAAFNEIVANISALDTTALALAAGDLDAPVLMASVPGRLGDSLRHSVDRLQRSIRDGEELRQNLRLSETRFRELADRSPDVVFRFSREPEPHIDYLSPSFEQLTGIPVAAVESDLRVFAAALDHDGRALLADAAAGRHFQPRVDLTFRRTDTTVAVFELRVVETTNGLNGVGRDVTEIRALQTQLAEQATRDPLTGLANRRLLDELLGRALLRADRSGSSLTVAFLDLDNFKSVNDTYGHEAGDTVLRVTAARLQTAARDADVVARYGGDEFVVVYEGTDDYTGFQLTQRIEDALDTPINIGNGITVRCGPSIGISDTRTTIANAAALISTADHAMLEVKMTRKHVGPPNPSSRSDRRELKPLSGE
jgi:diguanylate cyclase (GGDEF)-like protein